MTITIAIEKVTDYPRLNGKPKEVNDCSQNAQIAIRDIADFRNLQEKGGAFRYRVYTAQNVLVSVPSTLIT